ncbi:MAG: DUF1573 domain-containing protein [Candidatus Brocadiales bacterium]
MRVTATYLFLCLVACISLWVGEGSLRSAEAGEAPRIVFEEDSHNFGNVYKGEKVGHRFMFRNDGAGDLTIENVKASCGCTAAAPSQKTIQPGTVAEIGVTFKTNIFVGPVRKTVTVYSNDPETPHYVLTIKANVLEEVVAEPRSLWFDQIKIGQSTTKEVEIKPRTDLRLKVTKVRSTSPVLKPRFKKKDGENAYLLKMSTYKDAPLGRFAGDVQVFTNSKRQPVVTIPFFGEVVSDVSVFPTKISYGAVRKGKVAMRQILITVHNKDVKLEEFDVKPDYLSLHLIPDNANYFHRLEVILGKDVPVGRLEGSIQIHTTSKDQPLLTVPIYGVVREG